MLPSFADFGGMICPGCLREVAGLTGPDDLCPECFRIATQELIPSLYSEVLDEDEWQDDLEDPDDLSTRASWDMSELDPISDNDAFPEDSLFGDCGPPPTFGGRRRF